MIVKKISADGYKNLENINIELDPKMNIVCGENAQGKTNLIEAVWICTGCRSFRGTRDRDIIGFERDSAKIDIIFSDSERDQEINFSVKKSSLKEKLVSLNGVYLPLPSRLFGKFRCVVFTPEDLDLTKGPPDKRRSFIDLSIAQVKPSYISALNKYNNILSHRNALLKSMGNVSNANTSYLDVWNEQLAEVGAYISVLRYTFCIILNNYTNKLYNSITNGNENLKIYYQSTIFDDLQGETDFKNKLAKIYLNKLSETTDIDVRSGFTNYGIHRDDIGVFINDLPIREFGSQGQARSAALSMKLAHAKIIEKECGETPVILLDDVLSELDPSRKKFILNNIDGMQVVITCCDSSSVTSMTDGKVFEIKKGKVI